MRMNNTLSNHRNMKLHYFYLFWHLIEFHRIIWPWNSSIYYGFQNDFPIDKIMIMFWIFKKCIFWFSSNFFSFCWWFCLILAHQKVNFLLCFETNPNLQTSEFSEILQIFHYYMWDIEFGGFASKICNTIFLGTTMVPILSLNSHNSFQF